MDEKPVELEENWRNPDGTWKAGHPSTGGRTLGSLDFKTKWYKMVDKLAAQNNLTPEEIDQQLLLVGYKKAKDGDYSFYRDAMDRIHGRPMQPTDITSGGKEIPLNLIHYGDNKPTIHTEDISTPTT